MSVRRIDRDVEGGSPRGPWAHVPDELWLDWRWQHRNRVRSLADLQEVVCLTDRERRAFAGAAGLFRVAITPYYLALADPEDADCPIRRQAVPCIEELTTSSLERHDPLGEERLMPVPGITHRYPDRVLLYATHNCAVYCRHCLRRRKVADPASAPSRAQLAAGLEYIRCHPEVRDVLVSGGDPLTLSDSRLCELLEPLRAIEHLDVIRICTRNPATLPFRITDELVERLRGFAPLYLHTQFNHPRECTPEAARCLRSLADAGIPVANQMVLLKGVNDSASQIRETNLWLLRQRCRSYYLFQADLAEGTGHFRTSVQTGLDIIAALRGRVSGMAVPAYVIDAPGGGGKVPLLPASVISHDRKRIVFRSYDGRIHEYPAE